MEQKGKIEPHRITKPIQLLAAWLLGLILVNGTFLITAVNMVQLDWVVGVLVLASIVNVPLFLFSIFLLQTKFRPEMQEDSFYSKYLESKTGDAKREVAAEHIASLRADVVSIEKAVAEKLALNLGEVELKKLQWSLVTVRLNKNLSNFSNLVSALRKYNIPIHETFGAGNHEPSVFGVAIGSGFDLEQIKTLVDAILTVTDGRIYYAQPDDEIYTKQVLIGPYGQMTGGIELSKIKSVLDKDGLSLKEVYKTFGE